MRVRVSQDKSCDITEYYLESQKKSRYYCLVVVLLTFLSLSTLKCMTSNRTGVVVYTEIWGLHFARGRFLKGRSWCLIPISVLDLGTLKSDWNRIRLRSSVEGVLYSVAKGCDLIPQVTPDRSW